MQVSVVVLVPSVLTFPAAQAEIRDVVAEVQVGVAQAALLGTAVHAVPQLAPKLKFPVHVHVVTDAPKLAAARVPLPLAHAEQTPSPVSEFPALW